MDHIDAPDLESLPVLSHAVRVGEGRCGYFLRSWSRLAILCRKAGRPMDNLDRCFGLERVRVTCGSGTRQECFKDADHVFPLVPGQSRSDFDGPVNELVGVRRLHSQAAVDRLGRIPDLSEQHHSDGLFSSDDLSEELRVATTGRDVQSAEPRVEHGSARGEAEVAGKGDVEPSPNGRAVEGGNCQQGRGEDPLEGVEDGSYSAESAVRTAASRSARSAPAQKAARTDDRDGSNVFNTLKMIPWRRRYPHHARAEGIAPRWIIQRQHPRATTRATFDGGGAAPRRPCQLALVTTMAP
jgi:hypothetical protein